MHYKHKSVKVLLHFIHDSFPTKERIALIISLYWLKSPPIVATGCLKAVFGEWAIGEWATTSENGKKKHRELSLIHI